MIPLFVSTEARLPIACQLWSCFARCDGSKVDHHAFFAALFSTLGARNFSWTSGSCSLCSTLLRYSGSCQSSLLRSLSTALCSSLRGFPLRAAAIFARASGDILRPFKLAESFARYTGSSRLECIASRYKALFSGSCHRAFMVSLRLFVCSILSLIDTTPLHVTSHSIPHLRTLIQQ